MFDGSLRTEVDRVTKPLGKSLARIGVTADLLTLLGVVFSLIAGVLIVSGHLLLGVVAVVLAGVPDLLDGPVAKALHATSKRGAFIDSFSDRVSDFILFGSLAWYYIDRRDSTMALVSFACYGMASFISYQRAKAELLGFNAKGGLMERAERVLMLAIGLAIASLLPYVLIFILLASAVTVVQRFLKVWSQASKQIDKSKRTKRTYSSRRSRVRRDSVTSRTSRGGGLKARPYKSRVLARRSSEGLIKRFRDTYKA